MSKKLFILTTEIEIPVYAESAEDAKAGQALRDGIRDATGDLSPYDFDARAATHIPSGMELDDLVYHNGAGDITLREALATTPEYRESLERLRIIAGMCKLPQ